MSTVLLSTTMPSPVTRTLASLAERITGKVPRPMPQPISWWPSRIERGAGLRRDQPKASAPSCSASRSLRVDQGFFASGSCSA